MLAWAGAGRQAERTFAVKPEVFCMGQHLGVRRLLCSCCRPPAALVLDKELNQRRHRRIPQPTPLVHQQLVRGGVPVLLGPQLSVGFRLHPVPACLDRSGLRLDPGSGEGFRGKGFRGKGFYCCGQKCFYLMSSSATSNSSLCAAT